MNGRDRKRAEADSIVGSYLATRPESMVFPLQPPAYSAQETFGTNYVKWGRFGKREAIFKCFGDGARSRWINEIAFLTSLHSLGVTPAVYDFVPDTLIVMEKLAGATHHCRHPKTTFDGSKFDALAFELGRAFSGIALVDIEEIRFGNYSALEDYSVIPWSSKVESSILHYLDLFKTMRFPNKAAGVIYRAISAVEEILAQENLESRVPFYEDIHFNVDEAGNFVGFVDLEMSRSGLELMHYERLYSTSAVFSLNWEVVKNGIFYSTGRNFSEHDYCVMRGLSQFFWIIRATRWGRAQREEEASLPIIMKMVDEWNSYSLVAD